METILIADDHEMIRRGVRTLIESFSRNYAFIEKTSCAEVLQVLGDCEVHYAILDMNLSDGNCFSSMDAISAFCHRSHILVYSMNAEKLYANRLLRKGIRSFINKRASMQELEQAIRHLLKGESYISKGVKEAASRQLKSNQLENPIQALSDRELEVVEYITAGMGTKEMARHMNLDVTTVSTYRKRAFEKLDVDNRMDLKDMFQLYKMEE